MKLSSDIYIHFALEKKIGKNIVLKQHAETLDSVLIKVLSKISS